MILETAINLIISLSKNKEKNDSKVNCLFYKMWRYLTTTIWKAPSSWIDSANKKTQFMFEPKFAENKFSVLKLDVNPEQKFNTDESFFSN